jgi:lipopolysaccharide/colanic/teichoic acid biosynthesis glycosyltransferase
VHFNAFKFRTTARKGDDPGLSPIEKPQGNYHVTRVGTYLRCSRLEDLPQLLNVLGGSMSLVGPRPHAAALSARYAPVIDGYHERLIEKPGLIGVAQNYDGRCAADSRETMAACSRLDRDYIARPSLRRDLTICLQALLSFLTQNRAY